MQPTTPSAYVMDDRFSFALAAPTFLFPLLPGFPDFCFALGAIDTSEGAAAETARNRSHAPLLLGRARVYGDNI